MIKYSSLYTMIGRYYPFFLNNGNLENHYLYVFDSPGINEETGNPTFTMRKVSDRSSRKDGKLGNGLDILNYVFGSPKYPVVGRVEQITKDLMRKKTPIVTQKGMEFPRVDVQNLSLQKTLLINLRGSLRNRHYRYNPGRFIDVLWTPTEFVVFKIVGDKDGVSLSPIAAYKNLDVGMIDPLPVDLEKLEYKKDKFQIDANGKSSNLSMVIKEMEWQSFERKNFVK